MIFRKMKFYKLIIWIVITIGLIIMILGFYFKKDLLKLSGAVICNTAIFIDQFF
jgi:hypothetical protein